MQIMVVLEITMGVPVGVVVVSTRVNLDKPDAPFNHPPGQQALFAEIFGLGMFQAIHFFGGGCFLGKVNCFRCGGLHLVGQFVTGDSCRQIGVVTPVGEMFLVIFLNGVQ